MNRKKKVKNKNRVSLNLKKDKYFAFRKLVLMRIRFRAPIFVRSQEQISFVQIETGFLCEKSDAEMVLGSFVCSCDSAVRFLDRKFKPTSTAAMAQRRGKKKKKSSGGWVKIKVELPHFHVVSDTCVSI